MIFGVGRKRAVERVYDETHPGRKIRQVRLSRHPVLSHPKLAEIVGKSKTAVRKWEETDAYPSTDDLRKIGDHYGVPLAWFLDGQETPVPPARPTPRLVTDVAREGIGIEADPEDEELVELPYAGEIPASGFDAQLEHMGSVAVPIRFARRNAHRRFVCRVIGDSCEPFLRDRDLVVLEADESPSEGVFIVAQRQVDNAATLKLHRVNRAGLSNLVATNRSTPPPDPEGAWRPIALVVGAWRQLGDMSVVFHRNSGLTRASFGFSSGPIDL